MFMTESTIYVPACSGYIAARFHYCLTCQPIDKLCAYCVCQFTVLVVLAFAWHNRDDYARQLIFVPFFFFAVRSFALSRYVSIAPTLSLYCAPSCCNPFGNLFNRFGVPIDTNDHAPSARHSTPNNCKRFQLTAPLIKITIFVSQDRFLFHSFIHHFPWNSSSRLAVAIFHWHSDLWCYN